MSSTILCSAGSDDGVGVVGGGGNGEEECDASVVAAVASARAARRTVGVARVVRGLCTNIAKGSETELRRTPREGCGRKHFLRTIGGWRCGEQRTAGFAY